MGALTMRRAVYLLVWAAVAPGCLCQDPAGGNGTVPGKCADNAARLDVQKTDILFVVDDSSSMTDKQNAVATELPAFVQAMQQGAGVQQDFQMGVITTSVYVNFLLNGTLHYFPYPLKEGKLQPVPPSTDGGGVILLPDGGTLDCTLSGEQILDGGDPCLVEKFGRLVRVGVNGSGQETPFEAIRLASTVWNDVPLSQGGNQGFFRDGAQLLAITVMDEDDCSEFDDVTDAGWRPQVIIQPDKNQAIPDGGDTDYCTAQSSKLGTLQAYADIFKGLTDSQGAPRLMIWADIAPVGLDANRSVGLFQDFDAGTNRNVDCPISFGIGVRHRGMAQLFDTTLGDIDSICDANYHQALLNIAARAVAGQTVKVSGVPEPQLLIITITRANGTQQRCTVNGTDLPGANNAVDNITFGTDNTGQQIVQFHGACERRLDDTALSVSLICVD